MDNPNTIADGLRTSLGDKGFEIILDNIPESRKKIRETKPQFIVSDYQKVNRDFFLKISCCSAMMDSNEGTLAGSR